MKKFLLILLSILLIGTKATAKEKIDSLNIVEQIEKNLIYKKDVKKSHPESPIIIKKGKWEQEDTEALEAVAGNKINAKISTSKDDKRTISLKRKAYDAMQTEQIEVAIKIYKQILKKNKNDNYAKLSLATAYQRLGQFRQAKPLYLELLDKFPENEQIISNLLSIVIEETPYDAIYLIPALADKNPTSPLIQAQASMAYSNTQKYQKAIKYIKKSISLDPNNIQYRYNLAVLYDLTKDYNKALFFYKQISNEALRNEEKLNQIPYNEVQNRIDIINQNI